jgi:IS5 family transposase
VFGRLAIPSLTKKAPHRPGNTWHGRVKVERPFHIVNNLFHFRKVRYMGLVKNTAQLHTLFGLANLMIAKRRLLALNGQVAP